VSELDPATDQPVTDPPTTSPPTALIAVLGVAIGLAVAAAVLWLSTGDDTNDGDTDDDVAFPLSSTTVAGDAAAPASDFDPVELVVAYGRSRTEDHALDGELRRADQTPTPVRRAISGDRAIDEVGSTAAVTEAGETRQCELIENEWLCSPPLPEVTSEIDIQGFATLLLTDAPPYSIFAVSAEPPEQLASISELGPATCWSMVSAERRDRARFGAETTMCFHDDLGAMVGRLTETSAGDNVFIATDLRAQVTEADVEPSR